MGVPGLFSWVRKRFRGVAQEKTHKGEILFSEETCDNLYVDVNHILHSCAHSLGLEPADGPLGGIFHHIASYLDRIVEVARPERVCFLAVDGVAPKAKLAQQRTRRFLGAHRKKLARSIGKKLKEEMERKAGKEILPPKSFDQNIITPGTPFMHELMELLQEYVDAKLISDSKWNRLKVVLSKSSEPGEGEHKIMKFIRYQRQRPGYNPKTKHVVFGQDADLILLALGTHEPHFRIFREQMAGIGEPPLRRLPDFVELDVSKLRQYLRYGLNPYIPPRKEKHDEETTEEEGEIEGGGEGEDEEAAEEEGDDDASEETPEESVEEEPEFDFERTIEDFILLTFLLGNDFVPAVPSIDVYDTYGGLDRVMHCYKQMRAKESRFLTKGGKIDATRFRELLTLVATDERDAYRRIHNHRMKVKEQMRADKKPTNNETTLEKDANEKSTNKEPALEKGANTFEKHGYISLGTLPENMSLDEALGNKWSSLEQKEDWTGPDLAKLSEKELTEEFKSRREKRIDLLLLADCDADPFRFGQHGYEKRYYTGTKVSRSEESVSREALEMGRAYFQALAWLFAYYTVGAVPIATTEDSLLLQKDENSKKNRGKSGKRAPDEDETLYAAWDYSYDYHYAPLIHDIIRSCREASLDHVLRSGPIRRKATDLSVNVGPVPPFMQLVSVLPPESADACLPEQLARLLKATKPDSDDHLCIQTYVKRIRSMFPADLERMIDSRGKMWAHTVVVRLPSVDYNLLSECAIEAAQEMAFSDTEEERNLFDCAELYMRKEVAEELKKASDAAAALVDAAHGKQRGRSFNWEDDEQDIKADSIVDLIIPPFSTVSIDDEDDEAQVVEETVCFGFDIAGLLCKQTPCSLLPGAFPGQEPSLQGHQFHISPRPPPNNAHNPDSSGRSPGGNMHNSSQSSARGRGRRSYFRSGV